MAPMPSVSDLRLVQALAGTGSIGAAARRLQVSQPSASQRLARLERRCGVRLFERSSTGSRPTDGGKEMIRQADHILGHLSEVYEVVLAAADTTVLVVGTFPSLASALSPRSSWRSVVISSSNSGSTTVNGWSRGSPRARCTARWLASLTKPGCRAGRDRPGSATTGW